MKYTYELNNAKRDTDFVDGRLNEKSPVAEVFSALVNGKELSSLKIGAKQADACEKSIREMNRNAGEGDFKSRAELNTIRKFVYEPIILKDLQLLGLFGSMERIGFGETAEIDVYEAVGVEARQQAAGTDVTFGQVVKGTTPIATQMISSGYKLNYRKAQMGDMTFENTAMNNTRTEIRNKALQYVVKTIYDRIKNATSPVTNFEEASTLTKSGVDAVINSIRRYGKPSLTGDYAVLSQLTSWAGYFGTNGTTTFGNLAPSALEYFAVNGLLEWYNGCPMIEASAGYDFNALNTAGTNFELLSPAGLLFVTPSGVQSPVKTVIRGDLTTFSGNDVINGEIASRFDIEIGAEVARGREHMIGVINDSDAEGSAILA